MTTKLMIEELLSKVTFETDASRTARALVTSTVGPYPRQIFHDLFETVALQERYGTAPPAAMVCRVIGVVCASGRDSRGSWFGWIRSCDATGKWWYGKFSVPQGGPGLPKKGDLVRGVWRVVPLYGEVYRPELAMLKICPPLVVELEDLPIFSVEEADLKASLRQDRESTPPLVDTTWLDSLDRKKQKGRPKAEEDFQ